jgi:hypothetical protein
MNHGRIFIRSKAPSQCFFERSAVTRARAFRPLRVQS